MARFFAALVGMMMSLHVLALGLVLLAHKTDLLLGFWTMGPSLLVVAVTGYAVYSAAQILALAYATRMLRGPGTWAWRGPSRCRSLSFWLADEWDFYGNQGRNRGERFLGIEVAVEGNLP